MITRGRQLRQKAPVPERLLWKRLRDRRCAGLKFRRQEPLGPYVVDYLCLSARIVVELDGRTHEGHGADDVRRQDYLERLGLRVIRFTNDQVLADLDAVVETIAAMCAPSRPPSPGPTGHPLPEGEG
jgi:very-short-patch-repair endonuclease